MLRRTAILGMFLATFMGLSSVGALASPPAANDRSNSAGCVTAGGFTLVVAAQFAPDLAVKLDKNGNGMACVKLLSTPDNASTQFVGTDDRDQGSI